MKNKHKLLVFICMVFIIRLRNKVFFLSKILWTFKLIIIIIWNIMFIQWKKLTCLNVIWCNPVIWIIIYFSSCYKLSFKVNVALMKRWLFITLNFEHRSSEYTLYYLPRKNNSPNGFSCCNNTGIRCVNLLVCVCVSVHINIYIYRFCVL